MTSSTTPLRRSTRSRQKSASIYDEAKKEQESIKVKLSQKIEEGEKSDDNSSVHESSESERDDATIDSAAEITSDDEKRLPQSKRTKNLLSKKRVIPKSTKAKISTMKKIQVKLRSSPKSKRSGAANILPSVHRSVNNSLCSLAKKVLDNSEKMDDMSLVAVLLNSYHSDPVAKNHRSDLNDDTSSQPRTVYTPQLEITARKLISLHNEDPNSAQIHLLNLLFRSVGGTVETNLNVEEIQLEEMDNEDWGPLVTNLVDEMRHTPADCILFCADPLGAVHASAMEEGGGKFPSKNVPLTAASLGVREYRKIYEEFWYVLGNVALTQGSMSSSSSPKIEEEVNPIENSSDEDEDSQRKKEISKKKLKESTTNFTTTTCLDTELVRELLNRVTELVSVGQPDVRAAATVAALFLAHAIIDKTVLLGEKINITNRQFAAAKAKSSKKKSSAKVESLHHQIDSLKRMRATLEEIVLGPVIKGVFVHRYRDSNMFIRSACLDALSRMTIRRPDLFLSDMFLKYHGWMMSDKSEIVRCSALQGILNPFEVTQGATKASDDMDLSLMERVTTKFLPRITDSVIDVHVSVQERGMKLLLALLRTGLLDEIEDENMWNQINIRALAHDTSNEVRKYALYFIMEQLEAFDDGNDEDCNEATHAPNTKKGGKAHDRRVTQRLDAIASWAAHCLTDGQVPIEKIQIQLVNYLVTSLRAMPEHKNIVTNWSAMLRAIMEDHVALTSEGNVAGNRADQAKQRVLVQMLAQSAKVEVGSVTESTFIQGDIDPAIVEAEKKKLSMTKGGKRPKKGMNNVSSIGLQHENFTVALIKALPNLLAKFKSDPAILESLTSLPRYLIQTVFSLPQRKTDFLALVKSLTEIFLQSTDEEVLQNTVCSMIYVCNGDHARLDEAKVSVKKTVSKIYERIMTHLSENMEGTNLDDTNSISTSNDSLSTKNIDETVDGTNEIDNEYALYLNLKRMRVIVKRMDVSEYLVHDEATNIDHLESFCNAVADGIARRLAARKVQKGHDYILDTWGKKDVRYPSVVAGTVHEGLQFLLAVLGWKFSSALEKNGLVTDDSNCKMNAEDEDENGDLNHFVLTLRNRLLSLVELCFEQYLPNPDSFSEAQITWSDAVQESGGNLASDLRTLFNRELANASSPFLRAVSITDDSLLIGGYVRYFRSKEKEKLRKKEHTNEEDPDAVSLLLPICRAIFYNWKVGNRREAGVALAHITGSGSDASHVVTALSRLLKKVEPVRLLEAHMASLRQSYEDWIDNDPEEIDNDHPTDEEMAAFSDDEKRHEAQFQIIVNQAQRFSSSLGVNKLSDRKLSPALLGFIREGLRFSFSTSEDLVLGSRLSFLSILSKYAHWMKKSTEYKKTLSEDLHDRESSLKTHPEFEEIHEDDLTALAEFRLALGLKVSDVLTQANSISETASTQFNSMSPNSHHQTQDYEEESRDSVSDLKTPTPSTSLPSMIGRNATVSSIESVRSLVSSTRSSLSPLAEEVAGDGEDSPQSPTQTMYKSERKSNKRTRTNSGSISPSTHYRSQTTFDGEMSCDSANFESELNREKKIKTN